MTLKVYSVKSNARRDARKRGLDPNCVVAAPGGFVIDPPRAARSAGGVTKRRILSEMLSAGWQTAARLQSALGWQPHTVRGAISTLAKAEGLTVDRKREGKTTFYRVVRSA